MNDVTASQIEGIVQRLKRHEGVEYVYVAVSGVGNPRYEFGEEHGDLRAFADIVPSSHTWSMRRPHPVLDKAEMIVHAATLNSGPRLVQLAVATRRGHPIGKSIKRMVSRGAENLRKVAVG